MRRVVISAVVSIFAVVLALAMPAAIGWAQSQGQSASPQFTERPENLQPATTGFDYERREVMIPMRDGVRLHTVILVPKGAQNKAKSAGMLLTRTPYDADAQTNRSNSAHLGPTLWGYDNAVEVIVEGGYIRVVQDVRGKYGSEGDYVMTRPLSGPLNPTKVDHSTDTYDTIDWLVKHVPESNGRVGILGISYDGFLPLMALVNPHPALKVSVPMNPMVDGWMGDDWFHNGAFREQNMGYIYEQVATRDNHAHWFRSHFDDYDEYMEAGSAGELGRQRGLEQIGFWQKLLQHPSYDSWWQQQAMDKILAAQPLKVPVMLVHSLWDQEDIYGAPAVYRAIKPKDTGNDKVFLVLGPWHHGQEIENADTLGALRFGSDTGTYFRKQILAPFLAHFLNSEEPKMDVAPVNAYETGANKWLRLPNWPAGCATGCAMIPAHLYLARDHKLNLLRAPSPQGAPGGAGTNSFDEYVSDPAKPVPYRARPSQPMGYSTQLTWSFWLVDDQREPSGRTDVLVYKSDVVNSPVKISGQPVVNLTASTSGTDSDWVVKLIDVYPDEVAGQDSMGGFQLMVAADIFRGRYRESFETPKAIEPNMPLPYKFNLPTANHVFLPGHKIMVQVQSSWFPLYDRNPQTFVQNIFWAKPEDYKKTTQRVYHGSFIELPIVEAR
jgi:uncharacterized protein